MKLETVYRVTTATHLAAEMVERAVEARFATQTKVSIPGEPLLDMEQLIDELEEELKHLRMKFRIERGVATYDQIRSNIVSPLADVVRDLKDPALDEL